jgi:single-strand DNA-binding protein
MDGINKVTILGNLGADPELRVLPGGNAVLKLRVATNESWLDKDKNKQERTEWHRVTVFGRRAEGLARFVRKGMKVFVEGRNQTSTYEKEGQKHYSTDIIADQVLAFGTSRSSSSDPLTPLTEAADAPFTPYSAPASNGAFARGAPAAAVTDIPF